MADLSYSVSPHVKSGNSTRKIMLTVCASLLPAWIAGIVFFGYLAALTVLVAAVFALGAELVYRLITGEKAINIIKSFDYTSLVTGMIIGLTLPATVHLYIPALASVFAVIVVKMLFGGTGHNLVNPAAVGRIFAFISFTAILDTFVAPKIGAIKPVTITGATSLKSFLADGSSLSAIDLLLGTGVAGCIGETCKVAIFLGAIILAACGIIKIWLPLISVALCGLTAVLFAGFDFTVFLPAVLSGGFLFGAFFMATDYVTNHTTTAGQIIFFSAFGVLTAVLRKYTGFETTSFVILLMNILVPLIDKISLRKPFGYVKPEKRKEGK